jgi:uncharacterized protein YbgA (DUF1722 family)/uncharacterized protein YbbK (DUF523 family)
VTHSVIRLGISSCLLGEQVRWDGGHKLDQWLTDQLGRFVQYCPVCPEVGCGFGVPREPLCLVGDPQAPRLVTARTKQDHTGRMLQWARKRVRELYGKDLCGFIFKGRSPSCGTEGVPVYGVKGRSSPLSTGQGFFARAFMDHFPLVPVEDNGRLHNPQLRANFIERIFVMKEWRDGLRQQRRSRGDLVRFHSKHKLIILSHSPRHYRIMGDLMARATAMPRGTLYAEYQRLLIEALRFKATPAKHVHVLQHIMGYLKKQLSPEVRQELQEVIASYRQGQVSLIVPVTLINHYIRLYDLAFLTGQYYLTPHPLELWLRNYV